jgi:hypothetical protein
MNDTEQTRVEIDGTVLHVDGQDGEQVRIGPGGLHVKDRDSEVRVSWSGIRVQDGKTRFVLSIWKPAIGCGVAILVFAALATAVVMGVARLMLR